MSWWTDTLDLTIPPFLKRTNGYRYMKALMSVFENLENNTAASIKLRFPNLYSATSLAHIGRDRQIRRGPEESDAAYANRLRKWWDSHRTRGGPYALLSQFFDVFSESFDIQIDLVYQSGTRFQMDETGAITRDAIVWNGHGRGPEEWAYVWLFVHLEGLEPSPLLTESGDFLTTEDLDFLTTEGEGDGSGIAETAAALAKEWTAAHVAAITVVFLAPGYKLWGYPPDAVWGDADYPTWNAGPLIAIVD